MGYIELLIKNIEDYGLIIDDYIRNYYKIELKDIATEEMCYEDIYIIEENLLDTIRELKRVMRIK